MRSKPLLSPVVAAFERQQIVNLYLLEQLNVLRQELGYPPLEEHAIFDIIDGNSGSTSVTQTKRYAKPETDEINVNDSDIKVLEVSQNKQDSEESSQPKIEGKIQYAEALLCIDDGLGFGCDEYDLMDDEEAYVFGLMTSENGVFIPNPNPKFSERLLSVSNRGDLEKVVEIVDSVAMDANSKVKYGIKIIKPGETKLINGVWTIQTPAKIKIIIQA